MRYVRPAALLVALSSFLPAAASAASSLTVTNYHLFSETRQSRTVSLFTYTADLVNTGPAQPSLTATVSSLVPSIVVQPGYGSLHFPPVGANSTVTSTNFFAVMVDRSGNADFSNLVWTLSTPVANAGPAQTVTTGTTVTLNGSGSTNPSGVGTLTYLWSFISKPAGSSAVIQNSTSIMPTFVTDKPGSYVVMLTVSNGSGTDTSTVTINDVRSVPVANAGPDQKLPLILSTVTLNGSSSIDIDGNPLTYMWTFVQVPAGSTAVLQNPTSVMPFFVPDKVGTYKVQLVVNDGFSNSLPSVVTITSNDVAPTARAGANQSVKQGSLVQLDGSKSTDVNGNPLTYHWSFNSIPAGSTAVLSSTTAVNPTFTADVAGTYVVQLIVNDGFDDSLPSTVVITTNTILPPTANPGLGQTVKHGVTVTLDGTGSSDPNQPPLPLTYKWSLVSKPAGSSAVISNSASAAPSFVADLPGQYVAQLTVSNGVLSSSANVTITTTNTPPVANAGTAQTVKVGTTVTLDGSASSDADADPIKYSWSFLSVPTGSTAVLMSPSIAFPTFVADVAGTYVVQLIVSDPYSSSPPVTVMITAVPPLSITLSPSTLNLSLNTPGTITVSIPTPAAAGGQVIKLSVLDASVISIPASVTIPANATSTTFTVTPTGVGSAQILASGALLQLGSATVNVTQPAITLALSSPSVGITKTVTGTITLSAPAPAGGITVNLAADQSGIVSFPSTVTIASGTTGTFTVTGVAAGTANITASSASYTSGSASINVTTLGVINLQSGLTFVSGQTLPIGVTLISPAPAGGATITLVSSDPTVLTVSPSVFIPAGALAPVVSPNVIGIKPGTVTITASASGFPTVSTSVTVNPGLIVSPASLPVGTVGSPYPTITVSATGGVQPYTLSVTGLPQGLIFNTTTGVISGTPTAAGTATITVKDSGTQALTGTLTLVINPPALVVTPATLPSGTAGQAYGPVTIVASGGTPTYVLTAANLPLGLTFNPTTGVLSGTPTQPGDGTITVTDASSQTVTRTVHIAPAPLIITSATPPVGVVNSPYGPFTFTAAGGTGAYTFSATSLPAGLSLNSSTGVLSGTPTAAGTATIKVTDAGNPVQTATVSVVINTPTLTIVPASLPNGTVGVLYGPVTISETGGTGPYVLSASGLPNGLTFDPSTGVLTGTPGAAGTGTITVKDATNKTSSVSVTVVTAPLTTSPATLPAGTAGVAYPTTTITGSGGTPPYTVTVSGLPAGLTFTGGVLSGTPTVPGTATFTVKDSAGQTATLTLLINPAPFVVTTTSLPVGAVNVPYPTTTIGVTGGVLPYVFSATGLPAGLTLSASGVISGTPTAAGTATITVKDSSSTPQSKTLTLTVNSALVISPASLPVGIVGQAYPTTTITASGGTGTYVFTSANLPPGLSLSAGGVLSGTPGATGTGTITVQDTGSPTPQTATLNVVVNNPGLAITTASLPSGTVNVSYTFQVAASGGTQPYNFAATGLPAGLSIRSNGQITGVPSAQGSFNVTVNVTDAASGNAQKTFTLVINPPPLVVTTTSLPNGSVGAGYQVVLSATGGTTPYTWSVISGSLPAGLSLVTLPNGNTALRGTPTVAQTSTFVLGVKDSGTPQMTAQSGTLTVTIDSGGGLPSLTVTSATVGQNLQTSLTVTLNNLPAGPTNVTLTSDNPNVLFINGKFAPTQTLQVSGVQGTSFVVLVEGLASSGTANITAHASGATDGTSVVTLSPSGFILVGPNGTGASYLSNESASTPISVEAVQLDSSGNVGQVEQVRSGLTQVVTLTNSNPAAVSTPPGFPSSVTFTGGTDTQTFNFVAGTQPVSTVVTANTPAGYATPANGANTLPITVQQTKLTAFNVTVGQGLEAPTHILLGAKAQSALTITITSSDPTKLLLSTDPALAGKPSITMNIPVFGSQTQDFYVYGLKNTGTVAYTASEPGLGSANGVVTLGPSGFVLESGAGIGADFSTVTGAPPSNLAVDSALLDSSGNYVAEQAVAGGTSVSVTVTSSATSVGTVISPVVITGGNFTGASQFNPVGPGNALLTAVAPAGFSTAVQSAIHAQVSQPNIVVDSGSIIGQGLEQQANLSLGSSAPAGGTSVVLKATGSLLLSKNATDAGANSITITIPQGGFSATYFMYATDNNGTATVTATASGFNMATGTETLAPSSVVVTGPFGIGYGFTTSQSAGPQPVTVTTYVLDPSGYPLAPEPVSPVANGGSALQVPLTSSNTGVGTIATPAVIPVGSYMTTAQFAPKSSGNTTITAAQPGTFVAPSTGGTLNVTVN